VKHESLPANWRMGKIGDLLKIRNGYAFKSSEYQDEGALLIRQSNLGGKKVSLAKAKYLPKEYLDKYSNFLVTKGDILIGMSGSVGKLCSYERDEPALQNQRTGLLEFKDERQRRWIWNYLPLLEVELLKVAKGVAVQNISATQIENFPAPIAPPEQQKKIVEEVEKQLSRLDEAVANLKRVKANLKRYKASVLQAAVTGKLTEEWRKKNPNTEPADKLLERILTERRQKWEKTELARLRERHAQAKIDENWQPKNDKWKEKYKEPVAPGVSGFPTLPSGWIGVSVIQISFVISGQTPKGIKDMSNGGEIPWFKVGDMNTEGNEHYICHAETSLTKEQVKHLKLHIQLAGTIIFPKRGGAIATNKKRILKQPSCYDLNTMGIIPAEVCHGYFWIWFQSINLGTLGDGSNVPQINHGDIEPLLVPLPPRDEQVVIVQEVESRLSVAEEIARAVGVNLQRAERLHQSILKQAFSGKLV